jgi:hypothetical protein
LFEYGTIPVLHRLLHGGELLLHRADCGGEDGSSAFHWTCRRKIAPMSADSAASISMRCVIAIAMSAGRKTVGVSRGLMMLCDTCHALVMTEKLTDEKNFVANHDDLFDLI